MKDVIILNILVLSALMAALPNPMAYPVERAFLENSPEVLAGLFTGTGDITVSLPEPLSCADQLSPDQAFLVFKRIFSVFKTSEFIADVRLTTFPGKPGGILRARWSFQNERTGNRYPFRVFFYLVPEKSSPGGKSGYGFPALKIVEIRAEKL